MVVPFGMEVGTRITSVPIATSHSKASSKKGDKGHSISKQFLPWNKYGAHLPANCVKI